MVLRSLHLLLVDILRACSRALNQKMLKLGRLSCGRGWRLNERKNLDGFISWRPSLVLFLLAAIHKTDMASDICCLLWQSRVMFWKNCAGNIFPEGIGRNRREILRKLHLERPKRQPTYIPLPRLQSHSRHLFLFLFGHDVKFRTQGSPWFHFVMIFCVMCQPQHQTANNAQSYKILAKLRDVSN